MSRRVATDASDPSSWSLPCASRCPIPPPARRSRSTSGCHTPGRDRCAELVQAAQVTGRGSVIAVLVDDRPTDPEVPLAAAGLTRGTHLEVQRAGDNPPVRTHGTVGRHLAVTGGLEAGTTLPLPVGRHRIGRDDASDIHLPEHSVSRRHAVITVSPTGHITSSMS